MNKKRNFFFLASGSVLALGVFLIPTGIADASSLSLGTITPSTNIAAGTVVSFQADPLSFIAPPQYVISDSFPGSTLSNSDIKGSGLFNWTTSQLDVGTHTITVTATDQYGDNSSVSQSIVVGPASALSIQALSPGSTIFPNNPLTFEVAAPGFSVPSFSLSDSFGGSSLSNNNMSSAGVVNWTPKSSDVGIHNITLYVNGSGRTGTVFQTITVNGIAIQGVSANTLSVGTPFYFNIVAYGLDNPTYTVNDSLPYNTLTQGGALNGGTFNWTPQSQDVGTHTITVEASDQDGNNTSASMNVTVTNGNTVVSSSPTPTTSTDASPSSTIGVMFTSYLTVGSRGSEVSALQALLARLGLFTGPVTGQYGALTEKAVEAYQKSHSISALGVVGPATRVSLNSDAGNSSSSQTSPAQPSTGNSDGYVFNNEIRVGDTGTDVTELQKRLTSDGYYSGPITGTFGSLTKAAVVKFQSAHGLSTPGVVGPATRAALNA